LDGEVDGKLEVAGRGSLRRSTTGADTSWRSSTRLASTGRNRAIAARASSKITIVQGRDQVGAAMWVSSVEIEGE